MAIDEKEYLRQLEKKYGERRKKEFDKEHLTVLEYFKSVSAKLEQQYTIESVLAIGGTGIVHKGRHNRFHQPVVVKINRPNIEAEGISMVAKESEVLPTLSHPHIISVLDLDEDTKFSPKLTYIVEPFITGSQPLFKGDKDDREGTWLHEKIEELKRHIPATQEIGDADHTDQVIALVTTLLYEIASLFSQWVAALEEVHSEHDKAPHGYVYLDVKPENVLIDPYLNLISIDYGSVEQMDPKDPSPVEVFFTARYACRDLKNRQNNKPSSNRVRSSFGRNELNPRFDYVALAKSMLEILNEVALIRPHVVPQLPIYRSLHFLSTRLLNGENTARLDENIYKYASQVFPSLQESDYKNLAYENLREVQRDIAKERRRWSLEAKVLELATYSKDIVRVVPGFNTVLTERLRSIIEHPLIARLKYVTQLGLVSLVYPTADHSRFDHALGSYTYTTYYLKSLFNDLGNPIFRNLVGEEDLSAVLLAALLHDLGQYPLAHDLEEVNEPIFKHAPIGMELLKDPMTDQRGRTLQNIIEDPQNGWGIKIDSVRRILGELSKNLSPAEEDSKKSLKTKLLSVIIDGQIDADKADYIVRDSARCELPYGDQLDIERLLRVLTVAVIPGADSDHRITLGVYDKGLVSAHAFGQARYQLLSTVYWHHTSRIIKSMLQYSAAMGLPDIVFSSRPAEGEPKQEEIRQKLMTFVRLLVPPFNLSGQSDRQEPDAPLDLSAEPPQQAVDAIANDIDRKDETPSAPDGEEWYPGVAWTDWLMLQWIADLPDASAQSRNLIRGIQRRRLYKRIATFARGGPHDPLIEYFEEKRWPERVDICRKFHDQVYKRLKRDWGNLHTVTPLDESGLDKLAAQHLLILIDLPRPNQKVGYDRPLGVVPELKERLYHQDARQAFEDKAWRDVMLDMIKSSAPLRVLCHPDVRTLVSAAYAPPEDSSGTLESNFAKVLADAMGFQRS